MEDYGKMKRIWNELVMGTNIYSPPPKVWQDENGRSYGQVTESKSVPQKETEFIINGEKVMAHSRKDAIKRIAHRKKKNKK